jgi:EmrB/QacA subfamily drug resistance transporter
MPGQTVQHAIETGTSEPEVRRIAGLEVKWWVLLSVGTASFMGGLDASIVSVTLPVMRQELATSVATIEWVTTIYLLIISGVLLPFGRLGDLQGHKRIYTFGFIIFGISSVACGLAWNATALIVSRGVQAVGGGILFAASPALVTRHFSARQRGQAMGMQATMTYLALMVGPVLGGWLTDHFGWRSIFYINIPVCLAAIILTSIIIPHDRPEAQGEGFDFTGATLFILGLVALILALNQGHAWGWTSAAIVGLLAGAVVLLLVFALFESRTMHPMLDLTLFRRRRFSATVVSALMNYMSVSAFIFLLPFYLIQGRGFSTSLAGLISAVQPLVMVICAPISGTISDRIGQRGLASLGMALMGTGLLLGSRLGPAAPLSHVVLAMAIVGAGAGVFVAPNSSSLMGAAPVNRRGIAGGVLATARNCGMVLGVGFSGAIFTTILSRQAPTALFNGISAGLFFGVATALVGCLTSLIPARPQDVLECR